MVIERQLKFSPHPMSVTSLPVPEKHRTEILHFRSRRCDFLK